MSMRQTLMDKAEAELKRLEGELRRIQADAKLEQEKQFYVDELERRRGELRERLNEARHVGGEAWEEMRRGLEQALDDMNIALRRAKEQASSGAGR